MNLHDDRALTSIHNSLFCFAPFLRTTARQQWRQLQLGSSALASPITKEY
eukprot:SAG31_NODE_26808_length_436_cov_0.765579_1_plen_49_part_10